jgi:catechol 2,3-dioxygenase
VQACSLYQRPNQCTLISSTYHIHHNHPPTPNPQSAIRNPQSATPNPQSAIRNPQSAIRNPQSAIRNPQSAIRNSQSAIPMTPTRLPDATRIGAVHLTVSDLSRALDFYTEVLGFRQDNREAGVAALSGGGPAPLVVLHEQAGARRKPPRSTGLYHFAILTPSRPDLARSLKRLVDMRYPLQGASDHLVSEALYLADPDGNGIEIYADRPRERWPRQGDTLRMDTLPLDAEGLLAELSGDGRAWSGLPAATTIGHIHLHVDHLQPAQDFYCDLLGFDMIMRYGPTALFVSAGGYHHHVGLNTWAGVGAPPPPADAVGLRFFEIVLPDRAAWEALGERVAAEDGWRRRDAIRLQDPAHNAIHIVYESGAN